jgi:hypothetical protein
MPFLIQLLLILLFQVSAQEPSSESSTEESSSQSTKEENPKADEEIIVLGQSEVERRRNILDTQLRKTGYREGIRRGDKVLYRPEVVWRPTLVIYDSGFVDLRKTPPRFEPWVKGRKDNRWRYLSCLPPFTPMCVKASGWFITKRRAQHSKTEVVETNIILIQSWQEAILSVATQQRMDEGIPNFLEEIWDGNSPLSKQQRKQDILEFWSSRSCTPEGDQAAQVINDFIVFEIQQSDTPVTQAEKQEAEQNSICGRSIKSANKQ